MQTPHNLVLHPQTAIALDRLLASKPHAVIVEAPAGSGKHTVIRWLTTELAGVTDVDKALAQILFIDKGEDKSVKIEKVRNIEQFLVRRLPGNLARVVVVEDADSMKTDAQNALLKTLEEPPAGTTIVLVTSSVSALLPTIRSRAVTVSIKAPNPEALTTHFTALGHGVIDVNRAVLMSGGLPGLMHAILTSDESHAVFAAALEARSLIQATRFERLAKVDVLAKQKELAISVCQILQRMAHLRLQADPISKQWQSILQSSYTAEEQLLASGQPKLILTELMLNM